MVVNGLGRGHVLPGIVEQLTDRVDLLSDDAKEFWDIAEFLKELEKHDWDFQKMVEAGLLKRHENWLVYHQEYLEAKEEILW